MTALAPRRKSISRLRKRVCSKRPLVVECLEPRVLLSRDPLVIITHGFQLGEAEQIDWVVNLEAKIRSTMNMADLQPRFFNLNWSADAEPFDLVSLLTTATGIKTAADRVFGEVKTSIEHRTPDDGQLNVLFVGHSFGAAVNHFAISRLQQAFSPADPRVGILQEVTLDPVAPQLPDFLGGNLYPSKLPIVDVLENYYQDQGIFLISQRATEALSLISKLEPITALAPPQISLAMKTAKAVAKVAQVENLIQNVVVRQSETIVGAEKNVNLHQEKQIPLVDLDSTFLSQAFVAALPDLFPFILHENVHEWYAAAGAWSGFTVDVLKSEGQKPTSNPKLPVSGERYWVHFDIGSSYEEFQITSRADGNIAIDVFGLGNDFRGIAVLMDSTGKVLTVDRAFGSGRNARLTYANARKDEIFFLKIISTQTSQDAVIAVTHPEGVPHDPADELSPPRMFHDAAGQTFSDSRPVVLDRFNKGDDVGQISPKDDADFYRFVAKATGSIEIDVLPKSALVTIAALYDAQRDANGDEQPDKVDTDASDNDGISHFRYDVQAGGTYYVGIESKDHAATGTYELHIRPYDVDAAPGNSGTDGPPGPLPGWGGVRGVQVNLDPNGSGASRGSIDDPADVRWFQINGATAGYMEVTVLPVNDDLQPFVTAFRADGGGIDTDTGEFDGEARVAFQVGAGERIIIAVRSHEGRSMGGFTLNVSQPTNPPDDDVHDFGEMPRDLSAEITQEGDGSLSARIENSDDNDWYKIPVRGQGFLTIEIVASDSALVPFLELNRDGTSGGFFETDDGRDGRAKVTLIPEAGTPYVWAKVSSLDGTQGQYELTTWRGQNPDDDYPDSGGVFLSPRRLAAGGQIFVQGRLEYPADRDNFHIRVDQPGPVAIEVIPLTEGFVPFFVRSRHHADPGQWKDTSGGANAPGGRASEVIPDILPAPDNWITIDVKHDVGASQVASGDYIVHVWQPGGAADQDPGTVGVEAWPITLDGRGNGTDSTPALNFAGDKDVFQVTAAASRPITFTVEGRDAFLRIYDASGHAVATDHGSGPGGSSQVTLEADRGQRFYIEVTAFNGTDTGAYVVRVTQPTDDHADNPIFVPTGGQTRDSTLISLDASGYGQATGIIADNGAAAGNWPVLHGNHYYSVSKVPMSWHDAEALAVSLGGHLAAINSQAENEFVTGLIRDTLGSDYLAWIGLTDEGSEGTFSWTNGEPVTFTNFPAGEPNNYGTGEDYVLLNWTAKPPYAYLPPGVWNDRADASEDNPQGPIYAVLEFAEIPGSLVALPGDRDVFQVHAAQRGLFTIDVETTDARLDTFLSVYDSRGNMVAIDDDGGDGRNSRLTFPTFMGETYQIEVAGYSDNSVGKYRLTVQAAPEPRPTFVGTYDDFDDNGLDAKRWRSDVVHHSWVEETGGKVQLLAQGNGANDWDNSAWVQSRAPVIGDLELDFTPQLGTDENTSSIEFTDGTSLIRLQMNPGGPGRIQLLVESVGYTLLENVGPQLLTGGITYHFKLTQTDDETVLFLNGNRLARFAGPLLANTSVRANVDARQLTLYDDFGDNSIDSGRWNWQGDAIETGDGMHLWLRRDNQYRDSRIWSRGKPNGENIRGFKLNTDRSNNTICSGSAENWVGITNGSDFVRIRWGNDYNYLKVESSSAYGNFEYRWDPEPTGSNDKPDGPVEIRERNGNIEFLHNNQVRYTIPNKSILSGSWFEAVAYGKDGECGPMKQDYEFIIDSVQLYSDVARFASLEIDNVQGTLALPADAELVPYDGFSDGSIAPDKWHVAGTVQERNDRLWSGLFEGWQPVAGYASTAGMPDGTGLRGFWLNFSRTTDTKNLGTWEIDCSFELTNGTDFIRIGGLHKQTYFVETGGSYGSRHVNVSVPTDKIPDGGFEVRESDNNIQVLHDDVVLLVVPNQTVRAGSYFVFKTDGDVENIQNLPGKPEHFEATIDELKFYRDPVRTQLELAPALKKESDSGDSDADHVTNQLSLDFEWAVGADGTRYQWREGELQEDGTIVYGTWSAPQSGTTAHVDLPHGSIHVLSVRPIDAAGLVGEPSARAFAVDTSPPTLQNVEAVAGTNPRLVLEFNESVYGVQPDVTIQDESGNPIVPVTVTGWGTAQLTVEMTGPIWSGSASVRLNGTQSLKDIAGNRLDGDEDGSPGGDAVQAFTFVVNYWTNPTNAYDVNSQNGVTPLDVLELINWVNSHPGQTQLPGVQSTPPRFFDTSGDGTITAEDVIVIINYLNNQLAGGEGEAASWHPWPMIGEDRDPASDIASEVVHAQLIATPDEPPQTTAPWTAQARTWAAIPVVSTVLDAVIADSDMAGPTDELDLVIEDIADHITGIWKCIP